jgi:hypothetical protein
MIPKSGNRFSDQIMRYFVELAREPQISLRNLRKLDCFPQNRCPLLLIARLRYRKA